MSRGLQIRWLHTPQLRPGRWNIGAHDDDLFRIGCNHLIRADYLPELIEGEAIDDEDGWARVVPEFQEIGWADEKILCGIGVVPGSECELSLCAHDDHAAPAVER